jgi:hypothetical protein
LRTFRRAAERRFLLARICRDNLVAKGRSWRGSTGPDVLFTRQTWRGDGEGRNRTGDTTVFSRVLYQLSYLARAA